MDTFVLYAEKFYRTAMGEMLHRLEVWIFLALVALGAFIFFYATSTPQFKERIAKTSPTKLLVYTTFCFASSIAGMAMLFEFMDKVRQP